MEIWTNYETDPYFQKVGVHVHPDHIAMAVDHRVDRRTHVPHFWKWGLCVTFQSAFEVKV